MTPNNPTLPKLPLAFNIGITGHRPNRLPDTEPDALQAQLTAVLKLIANTVAELAATAEAQDLYNNAKPVLRLVSPLAEGADRIAAECAWAVGYRLQCPLPFQRELYADDFSDATSYYELLKRAERVLELDGETAKKRLAYRQAGRFVLHHADILLAVWNGEEDETSVGTAGLIAKAQRQGLPLLWINAAAPHDIKYFDRQADRDKWSDITAEWLRSLLESLLLPSPPPEQAHQGFDFLQKCCPGIYSDTYKDFYRQFEPRRNLIGTAYRAFFAFCGKRSRHFVGSPYRKDAEDQWKVIADASRHLPKDAKAGNTLENLIHRYFVRADSLASYYADRYRGTFVLSFFFGACAVLSAALGAPLKGLPECFGIFSYVELVFIIAMIGLIACAYIQQSHQHWLDFRMLSERLRQQAFMLPIGAASRRILPDYDDHDDSSRAWIDRFMRMLSRAEGMPDAYLDADYRQGYSHYLAEVVDDQAEYHKRNARRNENIATLLETGNICFLALVIIACVVHIWDHHSLHNEMAALVSTISAIALPAFGAAFAGILSQGEFERIAHRSEGMAKKLKEIVSNLKNNAEPLSTGQLDQFVNEASDIMSSELSDWRVIFRNKTLKAEP